MSSTIKVHQSLSEEMSSIWSLAWVELVTTESRSSTTCKPTGPFSRLGKHSWKRPWSLPRTTWTAPVDRRVEKRVSAEYALRLLMGAESSSVGHTRRSTFRDLSGVHRAWPRVENHRLRCRCIAAARNSAVLRDEPPECLLGNLFQNSSITFCQHYWWGEGGPVPQRCVCTDAMAFRAERLLLEKSWN